MANQDFLRKLPHSSHAFSRKTGVWERLHLDWQLLLLLLILAAVGLVVLYSASGGDSGTIYRQASRLGVALLVMIVVAQISPYHYRRWSPWLFGIGLALLIAVLFMGVGAKGAQRWLELPGLPRFQPAEIMKVAVPMLLAAYFADRRLPPSMKHLFFALLFVILPTLFVAGQPDLGTALLIAASGVFVLVFVGISWKLIFGAGAALTACLPVFWLLLKDYQKQRVLTFIDPERDPLGAGWNIIQSKTAIGSGGINGKGWMSGTQSQLDFLPESHTDFVIAVFAEEFGLVGMSLLLALYFVLVTRCLVIAVQANDTYGRLLAGSISLTLFFYVFVNIGMVSGILPVVGLPLPLISYGGTSIVTLFIGFGLLMSIHTHTRLLKR